MFLTIKLNVKSAERSLDGCAVVVDLLPLLFYSVGEVRVVCPFALRCGNVSNSEHVLQRQDCLILLVEILGDRASSYVVGANCSETSSASWGRSRSRETIESPLRVYIDRLSNRAHDAHHSR